MPDLRKDLNSLRETALTYLGILLILCFIIGLMFINGEDRGILRAKKVCMASPEIFEARMKMGPALEYELIGTELYVYSGGKRFRLHYRGEVLTDRKENGQ